MDDVINWSKKHALIWIVLVYVIVWLAVVFGINSASNAGRKILIMRSKAKHYYSFPACITRTINSKYYS